MNLTLRLKIVRCFATLFALAQLETANCGDLIGAAPERRLVVSDAIKIEYFVYGNGPETLILVAGNGRPAKDMEGIAQRVARDGYRAVTLNHRGVGSSEGTLDKATLHDLAADVWRVADALGVAKVHLLGKTFGQRVMRTASADQPGRVSSLILMGAGGEIMPDQETQDAYRRMREPGIAEAEWLKLYALANFAKINADKAKLALGGSSPKIGNAQLAVSQRTPMSEWTSGGTAPMLILQGLEDRVAVPQNAFNLATSRSNTWLVAIANCGHNMVFEQPEELSGHIVRFMRTHGTETKP